MSYTSGSHTVFHHRYHIVWITRIIATRCWKARCGSGYERLSGSCAKELGVQIVSGVLSREHVHMFVEIPPHIAVSDFVRRVKGRSSHQVQEWGFRTCASAARRRWARGYFSTTSSNVQDNVVAHLVQEHEPTGAPVVIHHVDRPVDPLRRRRSGGREKKRPLNRARRKRFRDNQSRR